MLLQFLSCKEELPTYEDPKNIMRASITGTYFFFQQYNEFKVFFKMTNRYDETLQGNAIFDGSGRIALKKDPKFAKSFVINRQLLAGSPRYDPATGNLTLDPGESIDFVFTWNFITDDSVDVRDSLFDYVEDPTCAAQGRLISRQENLVVEAKMQLYDKLAEIVAPPVELPLCHVNIWVDTRSCPLIVGDEACSKLP